MINFNGPSSQDLGALKKAVQSMPDNYKPAFSSTSKDVLDKVCDPDVLHIWESDSDIDNLLQLTSVTARMCNLGTRKKKGANASDGSMVIIAEENSKRNNFSRICQLVEYLTCANGKKHLEGTVVAFGTIVVVRGWNNSVRSDNAVKAMNSTVKRINTAIERVLRMGDFSSGEKIVWHHGPVLHFLLYWINNTSSTIRSYLTAITVTGSLDLTESIRPSKSGRVNTLPDVTNLESYARRLNIPVLFLDSASELIESPHFPTYMYYYGYYINTFLPPSLSRPHFHQAHDELVTFAFQIYGAYHSTYTSSIVALVKDHLDASHARSWANKCIHPRSYDKSSCRHAAREDAIYRIAQLADGPFAPFTPGIPAFARLAVGPAARGSHEFHVAAPVAIDFKAAHLRPCLPATFHVLIPAAAQDAEKITNRIQGLMMAVLECVRQEKGNPVLTAEQAGMWRAVKKSWAWALEASKGKMPKDVEEHVKFAREKLVRGTWGNALGEEKGQEVSEAAKANRDAERMYGKGGVGFGQPQHAQQYVAQQHMGVPSFAMPQQQQVMGAGFGGQHGVVAPQNSPAMGYAPVQQGLGYAPTMPGNRQQNQGGGYAPPQMRGGSGGYTQSMGGPWR
jgi:hypothetical protein